MSFAVTAVGQVFIQNVFEFVYLGGTTSSDSDPSGAMVRRLQTA